MAGLRSGSGKIDCLLKKVRYLEGDFSELEGCLFVIQRVNSLLEVKLIARSSIPGDHVWKLAEPLAREYDTSKDIIIKNIDKTYVISTTDEKSLQRRIAKFTLDSFKEKVFQKYKKNKESLKTKRKKKTTNQG